MSRVPAGEQIQVAPTNNVYTVLAAIAVIVQIIALVMLFMRGMALGGLFN